MGFVDIPEGIIESDCYFYHSLDFPDGSSVTGNWDLRGRFEDYTGNIDVKNKVVLDVGTASGFLAFEAEKRGAQVIALDMPIDGEWDTVPYAREKVVDVEKQLAEKHPNEDVNKRKEGVKRLRNGFFYAHNKFQSSVRLFETMVYDIPPSLGFVDVSFVGSILLHLRDPFLALHNAAALTREQIVISDLCPLKFDELTKRKPYIEFLPDETFSNPFAWWRLSPQALKRMLHVVGFEVEEEYYNNYPLNDRQSRVCTLVARRTRV
ncbi:hypothetical protein [Oceanidesulfovibrio indonesiensis]|uniref:hypothetical protein n=1 Tax=Oceanidesulfovibrio indonesiensis TaxID=54767 RepID=UPI0011861292|nr:hypothetical protein [Oceanidesulfovibrio indonesiensis]